MDSTQEQRRQPRLPFSVDVHIQTPELSCMLLLISVCLT